MTAPEPVRYSTTWLDRREPADARARSRELAAHVAADLARRRAGAADERPLVVHDLGSGTGSMGRWLAPLLPGPQRWVLHDRDPDLLHVAAARGATGDAPLVGLDLRPGDVTEVTAADLSGAALVTASALLDLLTLEEVEALAAACAGERVAALLTLSVVGRVDLDPVDPLDAAVAAAFDAHQRRIVAGRRLLGPDAVPAAASAFRERGAQVDVRASPWQLGRGDEALMSEWLRGWLDAAGEQCPDLRRNDNLDDYLRRRLSHADGGRLSLTVHHEDLLARWA